MLDLRCKLRVGEEELAAVEIMVHYPRVVDGKSELAEVGTHVALAHAHIVLVVHVRNCRVMDFLCPPQQRLEVGERARRDHQDLWSNVHERPANASAVSEVMGVLVVAHARVCV